jgi:EmrB/QacA subfamily drug resistance transporter
MTDPATLADTPDPRRWLALAVLLTGAFLGPLDFFIVNVAMPAIAGGLSASPAEIQLVISGYAVVYAVSLITGGRLGDLFGRQRIFVLGLGGFAVASALCGLAWSADVLIAARLLQALTAALMAPQALASVHALFPPHERARALSIYSVTIGLASVVGQLLGGALITADLGGLSWRLVFLINLPVSLAALVAALVLVRDTRSSRRPRLDVLGVVLSAGAVAALVVPLIEGRERGWPAWCLVLLAAAPVLGEAFRRWELFLAARGGEPLVAMEIFRAPGLLRGLGAITTLYALAAFFLTYAIYLQAGLGRSALQAGIGILPVSVGLLAASFASPAIGRWAGMASSSLGFVLSAVGLVATAQVVAATPAGVLPPPWLLAPVLAMIGGGVGLSIPTMMRVVVERVDQHRAGLVGGLVNTMLQISAALGVALLGGLFFSLRGARSDPGAIGQAFAATLLGVAACHLLGAVLAAGLGQRRARPTAAARSGG